MYRISFLLLLSILGCAGPSAYAPSPSPYSPSESAHPSQVHVQQPPEPEYLEFAILEAILGPSKSNFDVWDGIGSVDPQDAVTASMRILEADTQAGILAAAALLANSAYSAPDPMGYLKVTLVDGRQKQLALPVVDDTLTPSWVGAVPAIVVQRDQISEIMVHLIDADISDDDPIGDIYLDIDLIREIMEIGTPVYLDVSEQTNKQVLKLRVLAKRSSTQRMIIR